MADFSVALREELNKNEMAIPQDLNKDLFVQNALALLNGNSEKSKALQKFCKENPNGQMQVMQGLMKGAFLGLDFSMDEAYLIPYGNSLNYQTGYKGEIKLKQKHAIRPVKKIFAEIVKEGDEYESWEENGKKGYRFKKASFSNGAIKGAFAVCVYKDDSEDIDIEEMSLEELENTRKHSKASNSPAWRDFTSEMYRKTVIRRLCKRIDTDFTAQQREILNEEMAIETDPIERKNADVEAEANSVEFIDADAVEVTEDADGQASFA